MVHESRMQACTVCTSGNQMLSDPFHPAWQGAATERRKQAALQWHALHGGKPPDEQRRHLPALLQQLLAQPSTDAAQQPVAAEGDPQTEPDAAMQAQAAPPEQPAHPMSPPPPPPAELAALAAAHSCNPTLAAPAAVPAPPSSGAVAVQAALALRSSAAPALPPTTAPAVQAAPQDQPQPEPLLVPIVLRHWRDGRVERVLCGDEVLCGRLNSQLCSGGRPAAMQQLTAMAAAAGCPGERLLCLLLGCCAGWPRRLALLCLVSLTASPPCGPACSAGVPHHCQQ